MAPELLHIAHVNSTTIDQVLVIVGMVVATVALGWASVWMLRSGSNSGEVEPRRTRRRERLLTDENVEEGAERDGLGPDGGNRVVLKG